ncbi:amino acid permease [Schaalia sp. lx-260]|uniref:amino acid permease n=1 Tax=Schaalia sp. lx-260 TaxID=2899082 RepID=UPI001E294B07|nr:amino acid permease [Schaalia sp. lx-260]MCD4550250.1 amino acid permease [Schaalia sp. lx-260]
MHDTPNTSSISATAPDPFAYEQEGFHKGLTPRQMHMIAIGSAIGTGLFLGTGGRLEIAGPSLALIYAICGFFGYLILRALGELIVYRPSSGSFVSYMREFYGEKSAFVTGWLYWLNWAMTAVADATAIAIYISWFSRYIPFIAHIDQWVSALVIVIVVVALNLVSVKVFGELEFWFALIKVASLVIFLIVGICFLIFGTPTGTPTGFSLISENGGFFPHGALPALVVIQGVVFAYAGIELVGTASGEAKNVDTIIARAVNTVIFRIAIFYVGSVLLLCMLLPYTAYSDTESPFVTFFSSIGVDYAAPIMQLIVITAAASSMNAGIYSTGRILHSMAIAGSAPKCAGKISKLGVPTAGILITALVALFGVVLSAWVPEHAFEIVLNIAALGTMASWAAIALSHRKFLLHVKKGKYARPHYKAPGGTFSDWAIMVFLVIVTVLMAFDYPVGTYTLASLIVLAPLLIIGWFMVRKRVMEIAAVRDIPVLAHRPGVDIAHEHGWSPHQHSHNHHNDPDTKDK